MKEVEDNNVYLALDNHKSDEFILKQNLAALIASKNATTEKVTQGGGIHTGGVSAPEVANRREMYALQVKEEIYGATINAIIEQHLNYETKLCLVLKVTGSICWLARRQPYV